MSILRYTHTNIYEQAKLLSAMNLNTQGDEYRKFMPIPLAFAPPDNNFLKIEDNNQVRYQTQ